MTERCETSNASALSEREQALSALGDDVATDDASQQRVENIDAEATASEPNAEAEASAATTDPHAEAETETETGADVSSEGDAPRRDFWRRVAPWIAALTVLAGVLDALSTEMALATGLAWEANPVVRSIQAEIGSFWVIPKMIVHFGLAAVVLWFPRPFTLAVLGALAIVTLAAATNNFAIYVDILTDKDGVAAVRTIMSAF